VTVHRNMRSTARAPNRLPPRCAMTPAWTHRPPQPPGCHDRPGTGAGPGAARPFQGQVDRVRGGGCPWRGRMAWTRSRSPGCGSPTSGRQLEGLAGEFTVVAWDAPGCGRPADPRRGWSSRHRRPPTGERARPHGSRWRPAGRTTWTRGNSLLGLSWADGAGMSRLPPQPHENLRSFGQVYPGARGPCRRALSCRIQYGSEGAVLADLHTICTRCPACPHAAGLTCCSATKRQSRFFIGGEI
jgi:hypothetical protein